MCEALRSAVNDLTARLDSVALLSQEANGGVVELRKEQGTMGLRIQQATGIINQMVGGLEGAIQTKVEEGINAFAALEGQEVLRPLRERSGWTTGCPKWRRRWQPWK